MSKKVILTLQGGGALGAFECGVYKVLAPWLRAQGHELELVVGASIGALNAAIIVQHYGDNASAELENFWMRSIATPALPFMPLPTARAAALNGFLTGFLTGNRALFTPAYWHWTPLADAQRFTKPFYYTDGLRRSAQRIFGGAEYAGCQPILAVRATEIETGQARLFNSAEQPVTASMLSASAALPLLFEPGQVDGLHYWDGDIWGNSLIRETLQLLQSQTQEQVQHDYLLISVNTFCKSAAPTPTGALESIYRLAAILQGDKPDYDCHVVEQVNQKIKLVEKLHAAAADLAPGPLKQLIEQEHARLRETPRLRLELLSIERDNLPNDHLSNMFDFSPARIQTLIAQGESSAQQALADYRAQTQAPKNQATSKKRLARQRDTEIAEA